MTPRTLSTVIPPFGRRYVASCVHCGILRDDTGTRHFAIRSDAADYWTAHVNERHPVSRGEVVR